MARYAGPPHRTIAVTLVTVVLVTIAMMGRFARAPTTPTTVAGGGWDARSMKYTEEKYGLQKPDGHVIRTMKQVIEFELNLKGGDFLDYGAGTCGNTAWIAALNGGAWTPHACDISPKLIQECKQSTFGDLAQENFGVCGSAQDLRRLYKKKRFDLIVANEVLVYLPEKDQRELVAEFRGLLKPNGVLFATLLGVENTLFFTNSYPHKGDKAYRMVEPVSWLDEATPMHFRFSEDDALSLFEGHFNKVQLGYYDYIYREDLGREFYYNYVGRRQGEDGEAIDIEKHTLSFGTSDAPPLEISSDAVEGNVKSYKQRYKDGYGIQVPDSQNTRVLRQVIEMQLNLRGGAFLDFGAGTCGNTAYVANMNGGSWTPYGCDLVPEAVEQCKSRFPSVPENHFGVCGSAGDLRRLYMEDGMFNLIVSWGVLYYAGNDAEEREIVEEFHRVLKPGGAVFITMVGIQNRVYYLQSEPVDPKGDTLFRKIHAVGERFSETSIMRFRSTRKSVLELFSPLFAKVQLGYYDWSYREQDGNAFHYMYVGQRV